MSGRQRFSRLPGEGAWENPTCSFFGKAKSLEGAVEKLLWQSLQARRNLQLPGTEVRARPVERILSVFLAFPEKMRKVCVYVGSCCCLLLQLVLALPPFHRAMLQDGSFQAGSGMLAEAFKTDATLERRGVSKLSSENRLCLAED